MFAGAVSDRARSDPSKTQAAARPSHNVLSLSDNRTHRAQRLNIHNGIVDWSVSMRDTRVI